MFARLIAHFDPETAPEPRGLLGLIVSDYVAYYVPTPARTRWGVIGSYRKETPRRRALMFLPRMIHNPCLHATALIRLAIRSPAFLLGLWRVVLIAKHSIDIQGAMEFGPGLMMPHPHTITFGWGLRAGRNVTILPVVSLGGLVQRPEGRFSPTLGDDVVVFGHSMVLGPVVLGDGSVVGAGSWLTRDLAPGDVYFGGGVRQAAGG